MKHKKFDFRTAYIDLLLNVMTALIFLFVLTTLMISSNKEVKTEGIKKNAEYIAKVVWPSDIDCDVDIWVEDPDGNVVYFMQKDLGIMHIERDNIGFAGNPTRVNEETWVLRGIKQGDFLFNLHLYSCKKNDNRMQIDQEMKLPVDIELIKLNPTYKSITKKKINFTNIWQEITAFSVKLDEKGNFVKFNDDERSIIRVIKR